jgi:hypothetical protein
MNIEYIFSLGFTFKNYFGLDVEYFCHFGFELEIIIILA